MSFTVKKSAFLVFILLLNALFLNSAPYNFKNFDSFELDSKPQSPFTGSPPWYTITVGYTEINEPPPGEAFIVAEIPELMLKSAQKTQFETMGGYPYNHSNYTLVKYDFLNKPLPVPFALGEITYTMVKKDTEQGIEFSFYHYRADIVDWQVENSSEPSSYNLNEIRLERTLTIPANRWLIISLGKRDELTIRKSERVVDTLYRYFFINISNKYNSSK